MLAAHKNSFLLTVTLVASVGCNSLKARMTAQEGVNLYRDGKVTEAAQKFREAAQLAPEIPAVQLNLGFADLAVYQAAPRSLGGMVAAKGAIKAFEEYLKLRPAEERAKSYLVQTFVDTGHYEDAAEYFRPLVDKNPPDAEALSTLGTIAAKTGKFDEAKKWYARRIDADAKNADARLALAVLIWDHLHSHTDVTGTPRIKLANDAIHELCEAVKLKPSGPNGYTYLNLVFRERVLAAQNDDEKRVDLELAGKLFKLAMELGHAGADAQKLVEAGLRLEDEAELAERQSRLALEKAELAAREAALHPPPPPPEPKKKGKH
jgi:tetratricopeptide (TPR) repeat protein